MNAKDTILATSSSPKGLSPLEGNGNDYVSPLTRRRECFVRKDFPVGREWKTNLLKIPIEDDARPKGLSRWKGMETSRYGLL